MIAYMSSDCLMPRDEANGMGLCRKVETNRGRVLIDLEVCTGLQKCMGSILAIA